MYYPEYEFFEVFDGEYSYQDFLRDVDIHINNAIKFYEKRFRLPESDNEKREYVCKLLNYTRNILWKIILPLKDKMIEDVSEKEIISDLVLKLAYYTKDINPDAKSLWCESFKDNEKLINILNDVFNNGINLRDL